ncbi:hypothetical protein ACMX2I_17035 [Bacillus sp. SW14]|uniref:hypothetical protein n=1 Tax=Bacillus sp. SW14 TaxID=3391618 RepID=UPI0039E53473
MSNGMAPNTMQAAYIAMSASKVRGCLLRDAASEQSIAINKCKRVIIQRLQITIK